MINAKTPRRDDAKGFSVFTVLQSYILVSLRLCALASLRCGVLALTDRKRSQLGLTWGPLGP
jgi:hypothetical protein